MAVTDRVPVPAGLRDRADRLRRRPAREIDIAVAVVVSAATVVPTLVPVSQAWWIVALALLASAPVLWRRRAPMRIGLVVGVAMTALVIWQKPVLPYGPLVCVYTIAALSPPLRRMLSIPVIGVTVYVSLVLPDEQLEVYRAVGTAFVAAYALGTSARARRARAAELAERTRRLAQERAAAAARERTRIARDMHDILTHSVGLMVVQAEAGPVVMRSDRRRAEAAFDAIAETGRGALTQLRGLLGTLRSEESAGGEPQPSLDTVPHLVERTGRAGLEVTLTSAGEPRAVAADVDVAAYRIVQEALTNVLRHADARAVRVSLSWADTTLEIKVADDGRGAQDVTGGHGLAGMRERVTACGGTLRAGSGDEGFLVAATLPIG